MEAAEEETISIERRRPALSSFVYRQTLPGVVSSHGVCCELTARIPHGGSLSSELHTLSHSPAIRSQSEHGETQIMKPERDVLSRRTIPVRRQANAPLFAVNCKAELPIKLNREKSHIFSLLTSIDFTYDPAELTIFSR